MTETQSAEKGAREWEFAVTEHFTTTHTYYVRATTRQAAVDKVLAGDVDFIIRNDVLPSRAINVRDAERLGRVT